MDKVTDNLPPPVPTAGDGLPPLWLWEWGGAAKPLAVVALVLLSPLLFGNTNGQRGLLALCVLGFLFVLLAYAPKAAVPAALIYMSVVGGLRRGLIPIFGYTGTDPLLLVSAVLAVVFFAGLLVSRRLPSDTKLSRLVLGLLCFMVLEIVNPLQGGLAVGIAGGLFFIVPLLWYYLGRRYGAAQTLQAVFNMAIAIGIAAAFYGLYQMWFGYSAADQAYLAIVGYGAMLVSKDASRVFSFFTSYSEYCHFMGIALVLLWAAWLKRKYIAIVPIVGLSIMVWISGSRGLLLGTLATCVALWAVQGRSFVSWIPRGVLALALAVAGLIFSLHEVQQTTFDKHANDLIQHQTQILDPSKSDGGDHVTMVVNGYLEGFRVPIGHGLGFTTLAAGKFGGGGGSTEGDVSDVFASLGFIGGILYLVMIGLIFVLSLRHWHKTRSLVSLQTFALLFCEYGHWLLGAEYAGVLLVWFSIGALDRSSLPVPVRHPAARPVIPQSKRQMGGAS